MLVKNKYYYIECDNYPYIFLYNDDTKCPYIASNQIYCISSWKFWEDPKSKNLRLAINEEIIWLDTCIKVNKFVSKKLINYENIYECW